MQITFQTDRISYIENDPYQNSILMEIGEAIGYDLSKALLTDLSDIGDFFLSGTISQEVRTKIDSDQFQQARMIWESEVLYNIYMKCGIALKSTNTKFVDLVDAIAAIRE